MDIRFFNTEAYKMIEVVKYDNELLKGRVNKLSCFDSSNIIEPKNPSFKYTDNGSLYNLSFIIRKLIYMCYKMYKSI